MNIKINKVLIGLAILSSTLQLSANMHNSLTNLAYGLDRLKARIISLPVEQPPKELYNFRDFEQLGTTPLVSEFKLALQTLIKKIFSSPIKKDYSATKKENDALKSALEALIKKLESQKIAPGESSRVIIQKGIEITLTINPLFIRYAVDIVQKAHIDTTGYNLIITTYKKVLEQVTQYLSSPYKGLLTSTGFCEDLEILLSYPVEIQSIVDEAQTEITKAGYYDRPVSESMQAFVTAIDTFDKEITALLQSQPDTFKHCTSLNLEEYYKMLEKEQPRAYCQYETNKEGPRPGRPFKEFNKDMKEISADIEQYKTAHGLLPKTFLQQTIIKKINALVAYALDPSVCPICFSLNTSTTNPAMDEAQKLFTPLNSTGIYTPLLQNILTIKNIARYGCREVRYALSVNTAMERIKSIIQAYPLAGDKISLLKDITTLLSKLAQTALDRSLCQNCFVLDPKIIQTTLATTKTFFESLNSSGAYAPQLKDIEIILFVAENGYSAAQRKYAPIKG